MEKLFVGVDVGGTNVKLGLVSRSGNVLSRTRLVTECYKRNKIALIDAICDAILRLIQQKKLTKKNIQGIGFGLPGLINPPKGMVSFLPNIPGWKNVPLRDLVQKRLRVPVFIDNDVNVITLGEWKHGAGQHCANLICMTLGTGVGSGLILENKLYRGEGFVAGELGHVPLNEKGPVCNCGGYACFERYVGNQILLQKARRLFKRKDMAIQDIFPLANKGNKTAIRFWNETAAHLGNGLVGVVNLLNPKLIIIGGGVSNNYKFFHKPLVKILRARCMNVQGKMVKVVRARLGDSAGLIGAKVLVRQSMHD